MDVASEFIVWLKGFVAGLYEDIPNPDQWEQITAKLDEIEIVDDVDDEDESEDGDSE